LMQDGGQGAGLGALINSSSSSSRVGCQQYHAAYHQHPGLPLSAPSGTQSDILHWEPPQWLPDRCVVTETLLLLLHVYLDTAGIITSMGSFTMLCWCWSCWLVAPQMLCFHPQLCTLLRLLSALHAFLTTIIQYIICNVII
jgi:hypothetical protein